MGNAPHDMASNEIGSSTAGFTARDSRLRALPDRPATCAPLSAILSTLALIRSNGATASSRHCLRRVRACCAMDVLPK